MLSDAMPATVCYCYQELLTRGSDAREQHTPPIPLLDAAERYRFTPRGGDAAAASIDALWRHARALWMSY